MSPPTSSADVRAAFLDFFRGKGHEIVPSAPIIPPNDPTLMFTNAGMVPFKDLFTGRDKRSYVRAASSQKCIRISGKHNDLENVGRTARHQTFFEMLGNFSFGDYFKEDAIAFAWELLTKVYAIPKERMVVTVFRGEEGIAADDEARAIWRKVTGFGDDKVIGLGMDDNFWRMGDTGPCGPCSEIYYCHGGEPDVGRLQDEPAADGTGWVEIWNLVFMQFERSVDAQGTARLLPLPKPSIDTGSGLERMTGVLQGVKSNYDTDLLRPLVDKAAEISGKPYGGTMSDDDVSMRVIADHARTTAFMIAEGIMPDRSAREYVLRRVMRRAIRHGHRLGIARPFLHEVALEVVRGMGGHYGALVERKELIASVTEQEEIRFRETLARGLKILEEEFESLGVGAHSGGPGSGGGQNIDVSINDAVTRTGQAAAKVLPGAAAFRLFDTFGFPLDLTEVICQERGVDIDMAGYKAALAKAQAKSEFVGRETVVEQVYREALGKVPGGAVRFTGYEREKGEGKIVALIRGGALVDAIVEGDKGEVVLDVTPFYGEAGGQIGDQGTLAAGRGVSGADGGAAGANVAGADVAGAGGNGAVAKVVDTQKPIVGLVVHRVEVTSGRLSVGETVAAEVDHARRDATRRAHSATHLLHFALRRVLGEKAQQKGSLVEPDRFRFDFTSAKSLSPEERREVEDLVNDKVLANAPVETEVLPIDEAKKRGAMAIFEEKYGDVVRVLTMTQDSIELCGGTHARATGDIGLFKIVGEGGVAAGVRRIEAVTGKRAMAYVRDIEQTVQRAATAARASATDLVDKVEKLVQHERDLQKQVLDLEKKVALGGGGAAGGADAMLSRARDVGGVRVLGVGVEVGDPGALRETAEQLRDKLGDAVVLVAAKHGGKVQLVLTVAKVLTPRLRAGDLIRPIAQIVGGSGGGRPDMAQAGGPSLDKFDDAVESVYRVVGETLGV